MNYVIIHSALAALAISALPLPAVRPGGGHVLEHARLRQETTACSDTTSLVLAHAMILAAPVLITDDNMYLNNGEPLRAFVRALRPYFVQDGPAVRCAALVGPRLMQQGLALYDRDAYGRVIASAPPQVAEHAQEIANRINEPSMNMAEMGQELTWLAQILPAVADGDLKPFFETGYPIRNLKRQQAAQVWPIVQQICQLDGDCKEALATVLPLVRQMADQVAVGMIYSMARLASGEGSITSR